MINTLEDWPGAQRFLAEHDMAFTLVPETQPPVDAETEAFRRRLAQQIAAVFDVRPQHIGVCAHAGAGSQSWGWSQLCPTHARVYSQRWRARRARLRRMHSSYNRTRRARRRR